MMMGVFDSCKSWCAHARARLYFVAILRKSAARFRVERNRFACLSQLACSVSREEVPHELCMLSQGAGV